MRRLLEKPYFRSWLAMVGVITILAGTAYVLAQQSARIDANDKSTDMVNLVSVRLANGAEPTQAVPEYNSDVSANDLAFAVITSKDRQVLASTLNINNNFSILPPRDVFDNAVNKTNSLTWQPSKNIRLAISIRLESVDSKEYYILGGHSLRNTDEKIEKYISLALAGWLVSVSWVTLVYFFAGHLHEDRAINRKLKKTS